MLTGIKAVIFDMDGVIVDSEPLWRRVMISSFNEIGIPFSDHECRITTGLRFKEVVEFWFKKHNIQSIPIDEFDDLVIDRLHHLIKTESKLMIGVEEALENFKNNQYKIGLATSSNNKFMNYVVDTLKVRPYFDVLCSAEHMDYGKPHPEVFLECSKKLEVKPSECIVIEDSLNGLIAAKAAGMRAIVVPDQEHRDNPRFSLSDYQLNSLLELKF